MQRVVVDGEALEWVKMESAVPKSTALGPILFKGFVRPVMEYCSPAWNPHEQNYINMIGMLQRCPLHPQQIQQYKLRRQHAARA